MILRVNIKYETEKYTNILFHLVASVSIINLNGTQIVFKAEMEIETTSLACFIDFFSAAKEDRIYMHAVQFPGGMVYSLIR